MRNFRKLIVLRKAHALAINVYHIAKRIRGQDHISLRNQLLRAAMSIPTNIVEGTGQDSQKEFARFLTIALKSASELQYELTLAKDIRVISRCDFDSLLAQAIEVQKMTYALRNRVTADVTARNEVPTQ
jgi:four helix bundle protein